MTARFWTRIPIGLPDDPKFRDDLTDAGRVAFIVAYCAVAMTQTPGRFENRRHAERLLGDYGGELDALVDVGYLEEQDDGSLVVPEFEEWREQDRTTVERQRRFRDVHRNGESRPLPRKKKNKEEGSSSKNSSASDAASGASERTAGNRHTAPPEVLCHTCGDRFLRGERVEWVHDATSGIDVARHLVDFTSAGGCLRGVAA